ncbi:hypothetical protein AAG570_011832 [Ranatra chinensis]|uniref:Methyltransferase-like protein 17, mitochondrial n=1 Tax=Ranatra chinensis TaxID=642074 RepID=A0ABD0YH16_9HEMI
MASRKLFERLKLTWQVGLLRTSASTSKAKVMVTLDEGTRKAIENNTLKPRHHPGVVRNPTIHLPDTIKSAIKSVIGDTPMKQLTDASGELCRCLHARLAPVEHSQIHRMTKELMKVEHQNGCDTSSMLDEDLARYHQSLSDKVRYKLKQRVYNWRPLDSGNRHVALIYLVARSAAQYAVMSRVFAELTARDACFAPTTLFDFGSGVGTVSWTASEAWGGSLSEYFCVDSSSEMNDIARSITEMIDYKTYKKTFYRQFLPSSSERKYDVVVSSYSLLEMPSAQAREQTLINLWNKTEKYLVLVEYGTLAGFKAIISKVVLPVRMTEKGIGQGWFDLCSRGPDTQSVDSAQELENSRK